MCIRDSSSTADLVVGMRVTGAGIAANSTIASIDSSSQITLNNTPTAGTGVSLSFGYTATARTVTLTGTNTGSNTIAGILQNTSAVTTGVLSLTKSGTGMWTLSGANTYTGATTVSGGTLIVGAANAINGSAITVNNFGALLQVNSASSTSSTSTVAVSAGAIGGSGTINGAVTVSGTGRIKLSSDGATGTLTLGSTLSFTSASAGANLLTFDLGNNTNATDMIAVGSGGTSVTTAGAPVICFNQLGQSTGGRVTAGAYTLIQAAAAPTLTNYALATTAAYGSTYVLGISGNNLQVTTTQAGTGPAAPAWTSPTTGAWALGGNWGGTAPGYQSNVTINTTSQASQTLGQDFDINSLTIGSAATSALTIAKGSPTAPQVGMLTIEATNANGNTAGIGIVVNTPASGAPTHTISAPIGLAASQTWTVNAGAALTVSGVITDFGAGNSLTKDGAGTLQLSGANTFLGGLVIKAGTVVDNTANGAGFSNVSSLTLGDTGGSTTPAVLNFNFSVGALTSVTPINVVGNGQAQTDMIKWDAGCAYSLTHSGAITLGNNATLTVDHASPTSNDGHDVTFSGNVSGSGNLVIGNEGNGITSRVIFSGTSVNNSGSITNNGTGNVPTTISGNIGLSVTGVTQNSANSKLILSGANLYTGPTTITLGTLQIGNAGTTGSLLPSSAITDNGTLMFNRTNTVTQGIDFASAISGTGGLTQAGSGTLILSGTNTYNGPTLVNAGVLQYNNVGAIAGTSLTRNIYYGYNCTVAAGYAIDQTFLGRLDPSSTGTVALGGVNSSNNLDFSSGGANLSGYLGATSTGAVYTGTLTPQGTTYRLGGGGGTLTLSNANAVTGSGNSLVVRGSVVGTSIVNLTNANDVGTVTVNANTLQLSGPNGALNGTSPTINLNAFYDGIANTTPVGAMIVDNTGAGNNNNARISDNAAFNFGGGTFTYKGYNTAGTNSTETIGNLALVGSAAQSTFTVTFGSTNTAVVTAGTLTRAAGMGTMLVNGVNLGKDSTSIASVARLIPSAPTLVGTTAALSTGDGTNGTGAGAAKDTMIVPFLVGEATSTAGGLGTAGGTANTFVTYNATTGLRPLNPTDEFTNNAITSGTNTRIVTATNSTSTTAINSLVLNTANNVTGITITDGTALTVTSGAVLFVTGTTTIAPSGTTGTLDFGAAEGIVTVDSGVTSVISTPITGSGGLTKSGAGTLTLSGANTGLSGNFTLLSGTVQPGSLTTTSGTISPFGTGSINIYGGGFAHAQDNNGYSLSSTNINVYGDFSAESSGNVGITFQGPVTLFNGTRTISSSVNNGGAGPHFTGAIGDGGNGYGLNKTGAGVIYLDNTASTYSGKTSVYAGVLTVASIANLSANSALGAPTTAAAGTIDLYPGTTFGVSSGSSSYSTNRVLNLAGGPGTVTLSGFTNGNTTSFNGGITATGYGPKTIALSMGAGNPSIVIGAITDSTDSPTQLTMSGGNGNSITLNGVNTFTGPITSTFTANLIVGGSGKLGNGNYAGAISNTGTFNYASSATQTLSGVISNTGKLTMSGSGTLTLSGANTYSGTTTVSGGKLYVNGSNSGTGAVTVSSAATLGGNGSIAGAVTVNNGGILAPGTSAGTLGFGSGLTLAGGSVFDWENNTTNTLGTAGTNWDVANVTGGLTTLSSTASTGTKLKLEFTNALTNFSNSFWNFSRTWNFITGGVSAAIDASNISIYINSIVQGTGNTITNQGSFTTAASSGNLQLVWTPVGGSDPYDIWSQDKGLDGSNNGLDQNPDGDAYANLVEYAFDTDPLNASSGPGYITYDAGAYTISKHGQPTVTVVKHPSTVDVYAVFGRRQDYVAAGLTYTVQFSADLTTWESSTDTPAVIASDATIDAVQVSYPMFLSSGKKAAFFRVVVTKS